MNWIGFIKVLTLIAVTITSAMPRTACCCSNGELHLSCPKLWRNAPVEGRQSSICCSQKKAKPVKSCCAKKHVPEAKSTRHVKDSIPASIAIAENCQCTPVTLGASIIASQSTSVPYEITNGDLSVLTLDAPVDCRQVHRVVDHLKAVHSQSVDRLTLFERLVI